MNITKTKQFYKRKRRLDRDRWSIRISAILRRDITIGHKKVSRHLLLGLAGVMLMYLGVAGSISATVSWWSNHGDTPQHVDYVWRVYNGDIPKSSDGLRYPPFVAMKKNPTQRQPAAYNPPLFYAIQAPFMGPLLNRGKWVQAIALGRLINLGIGIMCILAMSWAGWVFAEKNKEIYAVAVPALGVLSDKFTNLNRDFAIEVLLALIATLTLLTMYKVIKHGLTRRYAMALLILAILGMLTKITYVVFLGLIPLTILSRVLWVTPDKGKRSKSLIVSVIFPIFVLICTGWFYYFWDLKSGINFVTNHVGNLSTNSRPYKSIKTLLFGKNFWELLYAKYTVIPEISTAITSFAVAGYISTDSRIKQFFKNKTQVAMTTLSLLVFVSILAIQFKFAIGYGALNQRYLIGAVLPISLFLAFGLLAFSKTRGMLVAVAAFLMGFNTLISIRGVNESRVYKYMPGFVNRIVSIASLNKVPSRVSLILISLFFIGIILLTKSLWSLSVSYKDRSSSSGL